MTTVATMDRMTARAADLNGWITIKGNPISKVGVYPYSGAQLGLTGAEAERIYQVYRPAEELADPDCIESFKLVPFIDEHAMLGDELNGMMPAERKGVQGVIGENVYFEAPYLRANLRIMSEAMKTLINSGKVELSPGYRCMYEFTPGTFEGQPYDAVQRKIRGNHLALVEEGRTGPDVAVLDKLCFTIDAKEIAAMADEMKSEGGGGLEKIKALLAELKPLMEEQKEAASLLAEMGLAPAAMVEEIEDEEAPAVVEEVVDEEMTEDKYDEKAMDKMQKALDAALAKIEKLEKSSAAMDSAILSSIADRDALASKVSSFVGTFDHSRMTLPQVAKYGVDKLGIPCQDGAEKVALEAWMHGRTPEHKQIHHAQDSKGVDILKSWGAK